MGEIIFDYRKFTEYVQVCSNKLYNNRKCIYCNISLPSVYKKLWFANEISKNRYHSHTKVCGRKKCEKQCVVCREEFESLEQYKLITAFVVIVQFIIITGLR